MAASIRVAFRFPRELIERLDAEAARMRQASPGLDVTRADVVRMLLERGLGMAPAPPVAAPRRRNRSGR